MSIGNSQRWTMHSQSPSFSCLGTRAVQGHRELPLLTMVPSLYSPVGAEGRIVKLAICNSDLKRESQHLAPFIYLSGTAIRSLRKAHRQYRLVSAISIRNQLRRVKTIPLDYAIPKEDEWSISRAYLPGGGEGPCVDAWEGAKSSADTRAGLR